MRKKFISALLFGALITASTSTLVSCKDYDDDITELRNAIAANETDLTSLIDGKVKTAEAEIARLNSQAEDLADAYKKADEALQAAIANAEKNANAYADIQRAEAEKAAVEAARKMVDEAVASLEASIASANAKIEEQGKTIAALIEADAELTKGIEAAKARANEAYDLADKAAKHAQENETKIEGLTTTLNSIVANLQTVKENLEGQISLLNGQVADLLKKAEAQAASITSLEEQLKSLRESNETAINELKSKDAKLTKLIEDNNTAINKRLDEEVEKLKKEAEENLKAAKAYTDAEILKVSNEIKSLDTKVGEIEKAYKAADTALRTELKGLIDNLQTQLNTLKSDQKVTDDAQNNRIKALEDLLKAIGNGDLKEFATKVQGMDTAISNLQSDVKKINEYISFLSKKLKSIVFSPEEYYQGIEAIGVWSFNYTKLDLKAANVATDQKADEATLTKVVNNVVPIVTANYYLNPSNADIDTKDLTRYSFLLNNATYTRGAASASDIKIDSVKNNSGKIGVFFSMKNSNNIANIGKEDGKVDVVALRYKDPKGGENDKDTIITSDFAALKHYKIENFYINKASKKGEVDKAGELHLEKKAADAISKKTAAFQIEYTDETGIDLNEWINVHYDYNNSKDKLWGGQTTINKKRFALKYELIGYQSPDYKTNESAHAKIEDGHVLKIQGYNGAKQDRQIIGRTPLVRVSLVDNNSDGAVAAVGYVLIEIVDVAKIPVSVTANAITDAYTVKCGNDNAIAGKQVITWDEVENQVLAEINMSKTEFEANYEFVAGKQYSYNESTHKATELASTANIGTVTKGTAEGGHQTEVLLWTIDNNQAYDLLVTKKQTSISTWVKFAPKASAHSLKDIYIKITWTPATVNKTPAATIQNTDKKEAAWFAANSTGKGYAEVHMQVKNGTNPDNDCTYDFVSANTFATSPLDVIKRDLGTTYKTLADAASVTYTFAAKADQSMAELKGAAYTVKDDEISKNGTTIATIDKTNGQITLGENDVVKKLINSYEKNEDGSPKLAEALTFTVVIKNETCEPAKSLITLNGNKFDVKVIRPVFINSATVADMTLDNHSTLVQNLSIAFEDFNGYNPTQFYENSNRKVSFWAFYGISKLAVDETKIETNYSGTWKTVDSNDFTVKYTAPTGNITLNNMGKVTLTQVNTNIAHSFNVRIPVTVTTTWGELKVSATLKVNKTPGGNSSSAKKH